MNFREFIIQCEIDDFYIDIRSTQDFYNRESANMVNRFPLVLPIHEAIILPENLKISSNLEDIILLNKEFKKMKIIFEFEPSNNPKKLNAYYIQEKDEIHIIYSTKNTKLEIEAMIGHEMIHREQNKRSSGNYFERAKKLTNEINDIIKEYNKTQNVEVFKLFQNKIKFKNFDDSYEQMTYVYQTVKENTELTPNQLVKYFKNLGFTIDFKLKKYIGMYWLIRDKL